VLSLQRFYPSYGFGVMCRPKTECRSFLKSWDVAYKIAMSCFIWIIKVAVQDGS